jgi:hypothetical protein
MDYKAKYLKYKNKYLSLQNELEGGYEGMMENKILEKKILEFNKNLIRISSIEKEKEKDLIPILNDMKTQILNNYLKLDKIHKINDNNINTSILQLKQNNIPDSANIIKIITLLINKKQEILEKYPITDDNIIPKKRKNINAINFVSIISNANEKLTK